MHATLNISYIQVTAVVLDDLAQPLLHRCLKSFRVSEAHKQIGRMDELAQLRGSPDSSQLLPYLNYLILADVGGRDGRCIEVET